MVKKDNVLLFLTTLLFLSPTRVFSTAIFNINIIEFGYSNSLLSIADLLIVIICTYIILKYKVVKKYTFFGKYLLFFGLVYIFIVFSYGTSIYVLDSISELSHYFFGAILGYFLIQNKITRKTTFISLLISFNILILISPLSLLYYKSYSYIDRAGTLGLGPNDLGWISSTLIIFYIFSIREKLLPKYVNLINLISGLMGFAMSASRRSIFIIGIFVIIYYFPRKIKSAIQIAIGSIIVVVFSPIILNQLLLRYPYIPILHRVQWMINANQGFTKDAGRVEYIKIFFDKIGSHLLLGYGSLIDVAKYMFNFETLHTHNLILQFIAQYGIITGVIISFILLKKMYTPLMSSFAKTSSFDYVQIQLTRSYLFTFLLFSFFTFPFVFYKNILFFMLFIVFSDYCLAKNYENY